jgi:uncharacterized phage-associated protein
MKTTDQILKIRATVLYVLNAFPNGVDYIKLFKILYFAQRQHLVDYGRTIIDDTFQARKYGPVSSFIRKGLRLKEFSQELPDDFKMFGDGIDVDLQPKCQIIRSTTSPDMDELSMSEIKCLDKFIKEFRDMKSDEISAISHEDSAWKTAYERWKKDPQQWNMSVLEIAEAGGANPNILAYIKENLELDQVLN